MHTKNLVSGDKTSVEAVKKCLYLLDMASPWPSCNSRSEALNGGFGHCLLSLWHALIAQLLKELISGVELIL